MSFTFENLMHGSVLKFAMLVICIILLALFIVNAYYFGFIHGTKPTREYEGISEAEALTMMWINIVASLIIGVFVLYFGYHVFVSPSNVKHIRTNSYALTGDRHGHTTAVPIAYSEDGEVLHPAVNDDGRLEFHGGGVAENYGHEMVHEPHSHYGGGREHMIEPMGRGMMMRRGNGEPHVDVVNHQPVRVSGRGVEVGPPHTHVQEHYPQSRYVLGTRYSH